MHSSDVEEKTHELKSVEYEEGAERGALKEETASGNNITSAEILSTVKLYRHGNTCQSSLSFIKACVISPVDWSVYCVTCAYTLNAFTAKSSFPPLPVLFNTKDGFVFEELRAKI